MWSGNDPAGEKGARVPAAVLFDACKLQRQKLRCSSSAILPEDFILKDLMEELAKMARVVARELPGCQTRDISVLDSTTGQNAVVQQAIKSIFWRWRNTGIILTKLRMVPQRSELAVSRSHNDLKNSGTSSPEVGEGMNDMQPFSPRRLCGSIVRTNQKERSAENVSGFTFPYVFFRVRCR